MKQLNFYTQCILRTPPDIEYIEAYNSVYNFRLERTENSCKVVVENVVGYNGDAILSIRQEDIEKNN